MACSFCSNIEKLRPIESGAFKGCCCPLTNETQLVQGTDGAYHLWDDGGGDSFVAGISVADILYCPKCGRELNKGADSSGRLE